MWCASFADYAKLAADGPSNLVERGAQVVEQLAVRANLPYQGAPSPAVIVRGEIVALSICDAGD
jgi:hypothetical protein